MQDSLYKLEKVLNMGIIFLQKPFLVFALIYSISIGFFDRNPFFMLMFFSSLYFIFVGFLFLLCQKNVFFSNMQKESLLSSSKQAQSFIQIQKIKSCIGPKILIFKCYSHENLENKGVLLNDVLALLDRHKNSKGHYMLDFDPAVLGDDESFYSFIEYVTHDERKLDQLVFTLPYSILCSFYEKISLLAKIGLNFNIFNIDDQGINDLLEKKPLFPIFSMEFSHQQLMDLRRDELFNERFYNLHSHAKYFIANNIQQELDLQRLPAIIDCAYGSFIEDIKTIGIENEIPYRYSKTIRPY